MHLPTGSPEENKTLAFAQSRQATTRAFPGSRLDDTAAAGLASSPARDNKRGLLGAIFSIAITASKTKWYSAFKDILPIYIGIYLAFFTLSCLTVLYTVP